MDDTLRKERLRIPQGKIHLIIDTDTKNEIDDQFAVSYALKTPERFIVDALYAAPFEHPEINVFSDQGAEESYQELIKLCDLLEMDMSGKIFRGCSRFMRDNGGKPVDSPAVQDLISRARASEELLYVVAIGAPTNIASAILMAPDIMDKIVLIWLGGQMHYFKNASDYNLMQDPKASQTLFDCGVPMVQIPCNGVASLLTLSKDEVEHSLLGHTKIADYLGENVLDCFRRGELPNGFEYRPEREVEDEAYLRSFPLGEGVRRSRIIWDIAAIAFLRNPIWVPTLYVEAPIVTDDLQYEQGENRHIIKVANYCYSDAIFGDMISKLTK